MMMTKMGFDERWVNMVMQCLISFTCSILINRHTIDMVKPERGLKQGGPLSPYLYLLYAEGIPSILKRVVYLGDLFDIQITPTSLFFFVCR